MRAGRIAAAAALLVLSVPVAARPLDALQEADAAVQSVGWKLARASAGQCARSGPAVGLLLQDARTFSDAAAARDAYGLSGDVAVAAVAAGSPAHTAGLEANDTLDGLDGRPISAWPQGRTGWDRLEALHDVIDAALARGGSVQVGVAGKPPVVLRGEPACRVRFIVDDGRGGARASRDRVRIGRRMYEQAGGDEGLLAAAIAHEMAHAVLDHQSRLEAKDRRAGETRRTEREADRLAPWLLARAGYPPADAVRLMRTIIRRSDFLGTGSLAHGSSGARAKAITREIAAMEATGSTDWARHFVPEG